MRMHLHLPTHASQASKQASQVSGLKSWNWNEAGFNRGRQKKKGGSTKKGIILSKAQWNVSQGVVSLWKHRPARWISEFLTFPSIIQSLFKPIEFFGINKVKLVEKNWNHVRKCQKFAKSSCQVMFSQPTKPWETFHFAKHTREAFIGNWGNSRSTSRGI